MMSDLEMKLRDVIWYSPLYIEKYLARFAQKVDPYVFETDNIYQKAREMRLGRVLALCLNVFRKQKGEQHFVSLPPKDPPDLCILGKNFGTKLHPMIYAVEVTTYIGEPTKGLTDLLIEADKIPNHHTLGPKDILLINVGIGLKPNYQELNDYLKNIQAPYTVWALKDVSREGTSIALFTEVYPRLRNVEVGIAEEAMKLQTKEKIDRIKINRSGSSQSGTFTKMDKIPEVVPWE